MKESESHIYNCADIILHDKNISETTIIIMFLEYKKLVEKELSNGNIRNNSKRP